MGLFGIYLLRARDDRELGEEKALIALVACASEHHTAVNIKKWTNEALKDMGLVAAKLLEEDDDE